MKKRDKRLRIALIQKQLARIAVGRCHADHAFNGNGGRGLSLFVWATFDCSLPGDKRRHLIKFVVGHNSASQKMIDEELPKIQGYVSHHINLD